MRWLGATLVCLMVFAGTHAAFAQKPSAEEAAADAAAANAPAPPPLPKSVSMDALLKRVKAGWNGERKENRDREAAFAKEKTDQQRLLNDAKTIGQSICRGTREMRANSFAA